MSILKKRKKEPWQVVAARFCVEAEQGVTISALREFISKRYPSVPPAHIDYFFDEEIAHPSGRQFARGHTVVEGLHFRAAPMELVSKITDYEELREARKNATNAFWMSGISILIALLSLLVAVLKS